MVGIAPRAARIESGGTATGAAMIFLGAITTVSPATSRDRMGDQQNPDEQHSEEKQARVDRRIIGATDEEKWAGADQRGG